MRSADTTPRNTEPVSLLGFIGICLTVATPVVTGVGLAVWLVFGTR